MSDLRKRKGAKAQADDSAAADCPKGGKEVSERMAPSGEWREWRPPSVFTYPRLDASQRDQKKRSC